MKDWAELPSDLRASIGKHLDNGVDVLRFRSVCRSWHSSVPPLQNCVPLPLPLEFPGPKALTTLRLSHPKIYHLQPISSSSSQEGWLLKLEDSEFSGKMRLLDPISNFEIPDYPPASAKLLNLLDFRVTQIAKPCALQFSSLLDLNVAYTEKVAVLSHNDPESTKFAAECAVLYSGQLGCWKSGDEEWRLLDGEKFYYHDVVSYKGKLCAVDKLGLAYWIDSSLSLTALPFSPPLPDLDGLTRKQKHLIESCGDIYVVDRFLDGERLAKDIDDVDAYDLLGYFVKYNYEAKAINFKIYKLEVEQDCSRWVEVKNLGDLSFFLCTDCSFSISAQQFGGCKTNCIYFTNASLTRSASDKCLVFDLNDGSISKLDYSKFFCPPFWLYSTQRSTDAESL